VNQRDKCRCQRIARQSNDKEAETDMFAYVTHNEDN